MDKRAVSAMVRLRKSFRRHVRSLHRMVYTHTTQVRDVMTEVMIVSSRQKLRKVFSM